MPLVPVFFDAYLRCSSILYSYENSTRVNFIFWLEVVYTLIRQHKQQKDRKKDTIEKDELEKIEDETDDQEDQVQKDVTMAKVGK